MGLSGATNLQEPFPSEIPLKQLNGAYRTRQLHDNDFVAFTELVILAFQNLNDHEASFKGNITSSNSRHIVMETLRNFTGLSKSDLIIMPWIKRAEIGSLRLMTLVPRTLLDVVLTASAIGSSVGKGIPAKSRAHLKP